MFRLIRNWTDSFQTVPYCIKIGGLLKIWNKFFFVFSVLSLAVDPLFFYIPIIDGTQKSLDVDRKLLNALCILRSLVDVLSLLHIILCSAFFRFPYAHSGSSGYLRSHLVIDLVASLPFPQAILMNIHNLDGSSPFLMTNLLKLLISCQFIIRIIRLKLIYKKVAKESGFITEKAWAGAAFIFFLYLLASHVVGSLWYLFAIESKLRCWSVACEMHNCDSKYLYRREGRVGDFGFLNTSCPLLERNEIKDPNNFDFGIFLEILQTGMLETRGLYNKMLYCSLWGQQSLSSLGQGLKASMYYEEILFVYFIAVIGVVLLAMLIVNIKRYLLSYSSLTHRLEEMIEKWEVTEELMSSHDLPDELRVRVRRHNLHKWNILRERVRRH